MTHTQPDTHGHADLSIETPPDDGIAVMVTNEIDPARDHARATLGGGFGLDNLTAQVARDSGTLQYGSRGASWLLTAMIPPTPTAIHTQSAEETPR